MSFVHTEFKDTQIHTAKCDVCDKHNTSVMKQCTLCAKNFCTSCWLACGEDGTHMLNSGDKGYVATEARAKSTAARPRSLSVLKPKKEKATVMKTPSPRLGGRSKRIRRRTVVIEESESEVDGLKNDQMGSDEDDDGYGEKTLETPQKLSAVGRGKRRRVPQIQKHVYNEHENASISQDYPVSGVVYPEIDTVLQEADAANSLLVLAAGSHGNPPNNGRSDNTGITHNTLPRISHTSFGNASGSKRTTIYNPISPTFMNSHNLADQSSMDPDMQPDAWYNVSANGTDLPVSMQVHPYPVNPGVTSRIIGHDSQGNYPPQALLNNGQARAPQNTQPNGLRNNQASAPHNTQASAEHNTTTTEDEGSVSPPASSLQEDSKESSLFIDPASDGEITAMSALMPEDPAWSTAPTTAMSDQEWKTWLSKEFPKELCNALSKVEPGMDARGERLFGNESRGEVWNSEIFNEHYFDEAQDEVDEGRAFAKANLDVGSGTRARRARAPDHNEEGSEEGEIKEDDEMGGME